MEHLRHFGLTRDPFVNDPLVNLYYASRGHANAEKRLLRGVSQQKGLCVLTGEEGTGKTMVVRHLLEDLEEDLYEACLLVPVAGIADGDWVLTRFARQLGVDEPAPDRSEVLGQIYEQLAIVREDGRSSVLIIDEAQVLVETGVLAELRGLLNLEYEERRLLSLVLVGLPSLETAIAETGLDARVDVFCRLEAMEPETAVQYLNHRIRVADGNPAILEASAVKRLIELAGGAPRRLNTLADNALYEAWLAGRTAASIADVETAVEDLKFHLAPPPVDATPETVAVIDTPVVAPPVTVTVSPAPTPEPQPTPVQTAALTPKATATPPPTPAVQEAPAAPQAPAVRESSEPRPPWEDEPVVAAPAAPVAVAPEPAPVAAPVAATPAPTPVATAPAPQAHQATERTPDPVAQRAPVAAPTTSPQVEIPVEPPPVASRPRAAAPPAPAPEPVAPAAAPVRERAPLAGDPDVTVVMPSPEVLLAAESPTPEAGPSTPSLDIETPAAPAPATPASEAPRGPKPSDSLAAALRELEPEAPVAAAPAAPRPAPAPTVGPGDVAPARQAAPRAAQPQPKPQRQAAPAAPAVPRRAPAPAAAPVTTPTDGPPKDDLDDLFTDLLDD